MSVPSEKPATTPIKILWINPVTTPIYNKPFADMIASVKSPHVEVHVTSLDLPGMNLTNLECRVNEAAITQPVLHVAHYAGKNGFDGYAIPCFYDTALKEAREVSGDMIVSAPCEASLIAITGICHRFSVIIGVGKWQVQMEDAIRGYGYGNRIVSFETIGLHVDEFHINSEETKRRMRGAVEKAVKAGAEGIILGCTIEFGFYSTLQEEYGIPVIDAAFACYVDVERKAMNKVQFGWKPSRIGSMEPPSEKDLETSGIYAGPLPVNKDIIIVPRE